MGKKDRPGDMIKIYNIISYNIEYKDRPCDEGVRGRQSCRLLNPSPHSHKLKKLYCYLYLDALSKADQKEITKKQA